MPKGIEAHIVKNPSSNARDPGSIPGWGRSPGEGHGNPVQYSCLENPTDRGACSLWGHKESCPTDQLFHPLGGSVERC